jgi:hypothetical protein
MQGQSLGRFHLLLRVEASAQDRRRSASIMEDPLTISQNAVNAPMNEHSKFRILKFLASLEIFGGGLIIRLC